MHSYMAILEHIQEPNFSAYWAIKMQWCMFCHLVTLWLPRWFSAKIFACDCSSGKKMFWNHFDGWKTRQRHAVHAFFLYLPWFLSYLQHCTMCILGTRMALWSKAEIRKIHFLMGKKYFWGYFSYVVLGRKL